MLTRRGMLRCRPLASQLVPITQARPSVLLNPAEVADSERSSLASCSPFVRSMSSASSNPKRKESADFGDLIYKGAYADPLRACQFASYFTAFAAVGGTPLVFLYSNPGVATSVRVLMSAVLVAYTVGTAAVVHKASSAYVRRMYFDKQRTRGVAVTLGIFSEKFHHFTLQSMTKVAKLAANTEVHLIGENESITENLQKETPSKKYLYIHKGALDNLESWKSAGRRHYG